MCGRYTLTSTLDDLAEILPGVDLEMLGAPRYNVAPTQRVPVVAAGAGRVEQYRWGLIPSWAKDATIGARLINARAETLADKPSFRNALRKRRCLVLADGFYEWRLVDGSSRKQPVHVTLRDRRAFAFAGLWEEWRSPDGPLRTCTIVTTQPCDAVRPVHDRMPVILPLDAHAAWLDGSADPATVLVPTREALVLRDVSTRVNDARHDAADCLA